MNNPLKRIEVDVAFMRSAGWEVTGTGGGCEAFTKQDGRTVWYLTEHADPSLPEDMNGACTLSLYHDGGDWIGGVDCVDVWQAMELSKLPHEQIEGFLKP